MTSDVRPSVAREIASYKERLRLTSGNYGVMRHFALDAYGTTCERCGLQLANHLVRFCGRGELVGAKPAKVLRMARESGWAPGFLLVRCPSCAKLQGDDPKPRKETEEAELEALATIRAKQEADPFSGMTLIEETQPQVDEQSPAERYAQWQARLAKGGR